MFNPIDMLQMPGGPGMQTMAQQFGLSPDQTRRAMEALMPVFAIGLQRKTPEDPTGLTQLFGSPMLTQAVLQQAANSSGVGSQVLRQMLPMIAGAVVASVVHMLLNQPEAARAAPAPAPAANPFPMNAAWTEMMKAFMPEAEQAKPTVPERARPVPPPAPRAKTADPAGAEAAKAGSEGGSEMLQQMFRTGAEGLEQNVKAMQGLFDAFWPEQGQGTAQKAPDGAKPVPPMAEKPAAPASAASKPRKGRASPTESDAS